MPSAELTAFLTGLERLDRTRNRMEKLFDEGRIRKRDLESVYEALFLRAVTSFEVYLENLFIGILRGKILYKPSRVSLRVSTVSDAALMDILLQGDKFMQWLPYKNTEDRAKLYLKNGRPFSDLDNGDRSTIKTITTIRNAIAHKSNHALNEFNRTVIATLPLLHGERYPAGFLRSQVTGGTVRNRFQVYTGELGRIALLLS